jgi:hypothetical protein
MSERDGEREPGLFDLPLRGGDEEGAEGGDSAPEPSGAGEAGTQRPVAPSRERVSRSEDDELPLFPVAPSARSTGGGAGAGGAGRPVPVPSPADRPVPVPGVAAAEAGPAAVPSRGPVPAPFGARLLAALADLGVHLMVAAVGWGGAAVAGVRIGAAELPALGVFLLAFSFLYSVVSLAFWGKTPGMAAAGVVSRGAGGRPLTFGQTGLRWLGGVLTALLAGLPLLLALTGRSLPDRLSGSATVRLH